MPTENRSSNTEMVSEPFQREERYVVIKISKMHPHPTFRAKHLSALKREHEDALVDCLVVERDWPEYEPTWAAIERRVTGAPAPQPHPEPIAWMVGTAFWWTKEEAERDAAATGLPIAGVGPMTDTGEVERLRTENIRLIEDRARFPDRPDDIGIMIGCHIGNLKNQAKSSEDYARKWRWKLEAAERKLAERDGLLAQMLERLNKAQIFGWDKKVAALSASAEPSAPAAQPGKCLDGGDCGIGGTCMWCPHATASPAQQPS